jgi:hypothetical protein
MGVIERLSSLMVLSQASWCTWVHLQGYHHLGTRMPQEVVVCASLCVVNWHLLIWHWIPAAIGYFRLRMSSLDLSTYRKIYHIRRGTTLIYPSLDGGPSAASHPSFPSFPPFISSPPLSVLSAFSRRSALSGPSSPLHHTHHSVQRRWIRILESHFRV